MKHHIMMAHAGVYLRKMLNSECQMGDPYVVRFKSPKEGQTTVTDLLRGDITVENSSLDDTYTDQN